jgi:trehalose/maltose transport system substrate-binding protein
MRFTPLAATIALLASLAAGAAGAVEITVACGSTGDSVEDCRKLTREWAARTGNSVRLYITPTSSTEQFALYRKHLEEQSGELDVLMVDLIWPGLLAPHLLDLRPYVKGGTKDHFPAIVANNTVGGKLLALPWFTDAGLMFYRKDLLAKYKQPVPRTWSAMIATARKIVEGERKAGNAAMSGYAFQGKAYEGLTCNALEWIASHGGGTFIDAHGRITINNPRAAQGFDMAASLREIAPADVLEFTEDDARSLFQDGNAVFMRNWSYAWGLAQREDSAVRGKIGVAPLPAGPGGARVGTFGGWQLAVSKYSAEPAAAADLVMFLTSKAVQKRRLIALGNLPTYPALYKDREILKAAPHLTIVVDTLKSAVARPSGVTGEKYQAVSTAVWNTSSAVLEGRIKGAGAVQRLEQELAKVRKGARW